MEVGTVVLYKTGTLYKTTSGVTGGAVGVVKIGFKNDRKTPKSFDTFMNNITVYWLQPNDKVIINNPKDNMIDVPAKVQAIYIDKVNGKYQKTIEIVTKTNKFLILNEDEAKKIVTLDW